MRGRKGNCTRCNKFTFNSKSGLCRNCWGKRAWGKDEECGIIYPDGSVDGATPLTKVKKKEPIIIYNPFKAMKQVEAFRKKHGRLPTEETDKEV